MKINENTSAEEIAEMLRQRFPDDPRLPLALKNLAAHGGDGTMVSFKLILSLTKKLRAATKEWFFNEEKFKQMRDMHEMSNLAGECIVTAYAAELESFISQVASDDYKEDLIDQIIEKLNVIKEVYKKEKLDKTSAAKRD